MRGDLATGSLSCPSCRFRPSLHTRQPQIARFSRAVSASRLATTKHTRTYSSATTSTSSSLDPTVAPPSSTSRPKRPKTTTKRAQVIPGWELTVGIEIHAQLNTRHKLFSPALNAPDSADPPTPNTLVSYFDLALPGSQPVFQTATLLPAIRASLALGCDIQRVSRWDRKHYFHWDQPNGYQITQYYEPLARHGRVELFARDGIATEEGEGKIEVRIERVQMEQDTAKTLHQPGGVRWIDFNRAGVPLVEIITGPDIHYPATAAALVRKVQTLLFSVDACVSGMEAGGLRADVNVSVRRDGAGVDEPLGTRVEIKNISSFRAVEDAIIAERDRQIALLEDDGEVVSETRAWTIGDTESQRLRGKEGEVDYRYMPDPDLGPVVIGDDVVAHLRDTMGMLPDAEVADLVVFYGMSEKDAMSLLALEGGGRAQFYYDVVLALEARLQHTAANDIPSSSLEGRAHRILAGNWVLHELGKLTSERNTAAGEDNSLGMTPEGTCRISAHALAELLCYLLQRRITGDVAKDVLFALYRDGKPDEVSAQNGEDVVAAMLDRDDAWFKDVGDDEYTRLAEQVVSQNGAVLDVFVQAEKQGKKFPTGKLMFLVGQVMRLRNSSGGSALDAKKVEAALRAVVSEIVERVHAENHY